MSPQLRRLNVLVADATDIGRQLAAFLIGKRGHSVRTAATAAELMTLLNPAVELVLIHLPLPETDAVSVVREVRRLAPLSALFALASAPADGFDETLIAPLNPAALDNTLVNLTQPTVDEPRLMRMLDGNRDLLGKMLDALGPAVESSLAGMKAAIESGDVASLARLAHRLKGSLGNLAADEVVAAARWLEQLGKAGDMNGARTAFARLDALTRRMRVELRRLI